MGFYGENEDIESDYSYFDDNQYTDQSLSPIETDILKVLNTYLTIMKYLLHKPEGRKKELKKNVKKIKKIKKALLERNGDIKKYLDEEGEYYDLL